jgi:hypothetical protein
MAARVEGGRARLLTQTGLDWTDKYPSVIAELSKVSAKAYLAGELCRVGDNGLPSFAQVRAAPAGLRNVALYVPSTDIISTFAGRHLRHDLGREDALSWGRKLR